jgi:hypothetical protein
LPRVRNHTHLASSKILARMQYHASFGNADWLDQRELLRATGVMDAFGPSIALHAVAGLVRQGLVEQAKVGARPVLRLL